MNKSILSILVLSSVLLSCVKHKGEVSSPVATTNELSITILGTDNMSSQKTKAASGEESTISSATAYVFRGSDDNAIIDCAPITLRTDNATTTAKVTSEAQWVFIVANQTSSISGVKTLGDLKAITAKLYDGSNLTQTEGSLIMWGSNTIDKRNSTYTSSVVLRFAPAKVNFKYSVTGANAADFTAHTMTIFNAQGTSRLFPENTVISSKADYYSLLPSAPSMNYLAGVFMDGFAVRPTSYTVATPLTNSTINSETTYTYYLFENDETYPTIVTLSGDFAGKTLYYPVAFSKADGSLTSSEFEPIKSGRQYNITINVKNVLAGSTDPTQPTTSQDVEITVVPADWETVIEWVKDFE